MPRWFIIYNIYIFLFTLFPHRMFLFLFREKRMLLNMHRRYRRYTYIKWQKKKLWLKKLLPPWADMIFNYTPLQTRLFYLWKTNEKCILFWSIWNGRMDLILNNRIWNVRIECVETFFARFLPVKILIKMLNFNA